MMKSYTKYIMHDDKSRMDDEKNIMDD